MTAHVPQEQTVMTRHPPTTPLPRTICAETVGQEQTVQFHALAFIGHLLRVLLRCVPGSFVRSNFGNIAIADRRTMFARVSPVC